MYTFHTTKQYTPFHLLERADGVWQITDCEPEENVYRYTVTLFADWDTFHQLTELELVVVPTEKPTKFVNLYALRAGI